jgi:hypothetical protein
MQILEVIALVSQLDMHGEHLEKKMAKGIFSPFALVICINPLSGLVDYTV